jgi:asparagine synthase (glutamine-hydrolysing)
MCGIFGVVGLNGREAGDESTLERMGEVQFHRGPDDHGYFVGRGVAFGMRRLSIIDLSGGHQPIANENRTVWTVCNGEIYNFQELREILTGKGHTFRSHSDTEVLVHLYEEEGVPFLKRLRGMFALAIWDEPRQRLVLARDRLGKKPLYVRREANRLLFASELKSIIWDPAVPRRLDPEALGEYLALGYVPAPLTMFEGVEKLQPGHALVIEQDRISDHEYWEVRFDQTDRATEEEWAERVREKLLESVRIRLVSDVPLGAFLSGGVDSSAIVSAMASLTSRPVKTYSIGFEGKDAYYNELPYARMVAERLKTDHHEIIVKPQVAELLPKLIWHLDEPIADSAQVTTYLVAQLARRSVTVILSGVGGDELFGGYRRYLGRGLMRYFRLLPKSIRTWLLPSLLAKLPQDRHSCVQNYIRYATAFVKSSELPPDLRYLSYIALCSPEVRAGLLREPRTFGVGVDSPALSKVMSQHFDRVKGADELDQMIYVDMKTSLPDDLLLLTDKMTMAVSLECRAPFMDHELVELTSRMPADMKIRGLTMKYILKKALTPWLPAEILHRKKRGFGAPMGSWLRAELGPLIADTLSETAVRRRGLLDWRAVKSLLDAHQAKQEDHTDPLLALINLELWCRIFLDGTEWRTAPPVSASYAGVGG